MYSETNYHSGHQRFSYDGLHPLRNQPVVATFLQPGLPEHIDSPPDDPIGPTSRATLGI